MDQFLIQHGGHDIMQRLAKLSPAAKLLLLAGVFATAYVAFARARKFTMAGLMSLTVLVLLISAAVVGLITLLVQMYRLIRVRLLKPVDLQ